ncbi:hypothetical protein GZ77_03495 [Endozoicomonas montiporae]|uniref:Uncharacterized protein n=2 Tax=Endozoicomonas montiporae TaxID=1027273 RepID=A0A081NB36_9GAMM|nr:hypothetical protein [Endozoicomonas montiporae]AMO56633.1 hypothetical protein EZMO1_2554 [Endozoicomonas montiporae CL-33]KEQ15659.1 hypothetical protein GZ77_03495 [Endozoicomonas montiporae]
MIPLIIGAAALTAGLGAGSFVGAQVDDALDQGSGGGMRTDSLILGAALIGVVYLVVKKGKLL